MRGGLSLPVASFFRVLFVVTRMTEAYQVVIFPHKLRIFVRMLYVVYLCRLNYSAISLAVLAFVSVPAQDGRTLALPPRRSIVKRHQSFPANSFIFVLSVSSLFVAISKYPLCVSKPQYSSPAR